MRRNRERNRATTVFWSACDWLCCASSSSGQRAAESTENSSRNRSRSSCHSVYEVVNETNAHPSTVVDPTVHTTEGRSPALSGKNSRKISPVIQPRLGVDHAVLRQKFDAMTANRKLTVLSTTQSEDLEFCRSYVINSNGYSITSPPSLSSTECRKTSQPLDFRNNRTVHHKFSLVEQRSKPPAVFSPRDTQSLPSSRSFISPTYALQSYVKPENSCPMEQLEEETVEPDTVDVLRLASENYDFQQFQIVFNDWIKGETGCRGSAFIINSSEYDCSVCHVCDSEVLEEPISCGDSEKFTEALGFATSAAESVHDQDQTPSTSKVIGPVMIDIREFNEEISEPLWKIVNIIASHSSARETGAPAASVCGVMTGCGFVTALLLVHQSESKRNDELKTLLHHFGMIASLTSVAWNVEEQRRIAHQSEIVLSTTQSVFASIRKCFRVI